MNDAERDRRNERSRLLAFLKRGGVLLREDYGGVVGVQWRRASRGGPGFNTDACQRLIDKGCTIEGEKLSLQVATGFPPGTFNLRPAPPSEKAKPKRRAAAEAHASA